MSERAVIRDGARVLGTVPAGSKVMRNPFGFGFIAVHPGRPPCIIDAAGVRPLVEFDHG